MLRGRAYFYNDYYRRVYGLVARDRPRDLDIEVMRHAANFNVALDTCA